MTIADRDFLYTWINQLKQFLTFNAAVVKETYKIMLIGNHLFVFAKCYDCHLKFALEDYYSSFFFLIGGEKEIPPV